MLEERQKKVLLYLLQNTHRYLSSEEIAKYLSCSSRTVQNDLHILETSFDKERLKIDSKAGHGYRLQIKKALSLKNINEISEWIYEESEEKELIASLICFMLIKDDFVTKESMKQSLFISKAKLKECLTKIEASLKQNKLRLKSVSGQGFYIHGPNLSKRYALLYYSRQIEGRTPKQIRLYFNNYQYLYKQNYKQKVEDLLQKHPLLKTEKEKERLHNYLIASLLLPKTKQDESIQVYCYQEKAQALAQSIAKLLFEDDPLERKDLFITLSLILPPTSFQAHPKASITDIISQKVTQFIETKQTIFLCHEDLEEELLRASMMIYAHKIVGYRSLDQSHLYQNFDLEYLFSERMASLYLLNLSKELGFDFYSEDVAYLSRILNLFLAKDLFKTKTSLAIAYDKKPSQAAYLARKLSQRTTMDVQTVSLHAMSSSLENIDFIIASEKTVCKKEGVLCFSSLLQFRSIEKYLKHQIKIKRQKRLANFFEKQATIHSPLPSSLWEETIEKLTQKKASEIKDHLPRHLLFETDEIQCVVYEDKQVETMEALILHQDKATSYQGRKLKALFLFRISDASLWPDIVLLEYRLMQKEEVRQKLLQSKSKEAFKENLKTFLS